MKVKVTRQDNAIDIVVDDMVDPGEPGDGATINGKPARELSRTIYSCCANGGLVSAYDEHDNRYVLADFDECRRAAGIRDYITVSTASGPRFEEQYPRTDVFRAAVMAACLSKAIREADDVGWRRSNALNRIANELVSVVSGRDGSDYDARFAMWGAVLDARDIGRLTPPTSYDIMRNVARDPAEGVGGVPAAGRTGTPTQPPGETS